MDEIYVLAPPARARELFDTVAEAVQRIAGVRTHIGKLRAWSRSPTERPTQWEDLGEEVWVADAEPSKRGVKVLGMPL